MSGMRVKANVFGLGVGRDVSDGGGWISVSGCEVLGVRTRSLRSSRKEKKRRPTRDGLPGPVI